MNSSLENEERFLGILQKLLAIPASELSVALSHASDALAEATHAEKVDAFLYDASRDTLVAVGTSAQPLSNLQKALGLDVLPLSNGGRVVQVFQTGVTHYTGSLFDDPDEVRGIKEGLKVQSQVGVPLEIGGERRGTVMIASTQPDAFSTLDVSFVESAVRWVGLVAKHAELLQSIEQNAVEQGRASSAEEMIAVLAHDLRNYLTPVTLRLYRMRKQATKDARLQDTEDINGALATLARMAGLITDLLDTARIDSGAFALALQPVDLAEIIGESARLLTTPDHEIMVRSRVPTVVSADASRLRQCIDNLLSNAISHSPENAPVDVLISTRREADHAIALVEIVDEGPGIPEGVLPQLFQKFATGRLEHGGIGLGLYIARRVAVAHGGDLAADRHPGKGARFTLRIPLLEGTDTAGTLPEPPGP